MELFVNMIWIGRRDPCAAPGAAVLLVLMALQMAAGSATLVLDESTAASWLHEIGAIVLLTVAFVLLTSRQQAPM